METRRDRRGSVEKAVLSTSEKFAFVCADPAVSELVCVYLQPTCSVDCCDEFGGEFDCL